MQACTNYHSPFRDSEFDVLHKMDFQTVNGILIYLISHALRFKLPLPYTIQNIFDCTTDAHSFYNVSHILSTSSAAIRHSSRFCY